MSNQRSILVTGAAGFIGFHTSLSLIDLGEKVIGLDNYDPYYSVDLKYKRRDLLEEKGMEIIVGDINDEELLLKIIKDHKITHIIQLAAQAGVRYSLINPKAYIKTNVEGFLTVLEVVRHHSHIKLIWASSSSVYGLNEKLPYSPEDRTDLQASLYGVTKKTDELMAATYHHLFDLDLIGLRFFTVYGPWGRPDMAYFSFTKSIIEGKEIDLYNNGKCFRDFTFVDDIVKGIVACLELPKGHQIYNLGNHKPVEVLKFVNVLEEHLNLKARVNLLPAQPGDVEATWADIEKSQNDLNFSPETTIEEGLKKFVAWYRQEYPQ